MNCFFVVVNNDKTLNANVVFDILYSKLFIEQMAPLMSEKIILECIQIQNFWPNKALGSMDIRTYNECGLQGETEEISSRPFLLSFSSSLMKSSKNAATFIIPGVVSKFKNLQELKTKKGDFEQLKEFLGNPIKLGSSDNVVLSLVAPTAKAGSISAFVPVTSCSVVGFSGNARKSVKFKKVASSP